MASPCTTLDEYIQAAPEDVRALLQEMRQVVQEAAPDATEAIRYRIPTFQLRGRNLVHFAAFKHHLGFYPTSSGVEAFRAELSPYVVSTGAIQFPFGQPVPWDLVRRIVAFRVAEVSAGE